MTQMSTQTLQGYRARLKTGGELTRDEQFAVINHSLAVLDIMHGGKSVVDQQQDLRARENRVKDALRDINQAIIDADTELARNMVAAALQMFRSKQTKDFQKWSDFLVMLAENHQRLESHPKVLTDKAIVSQQLTEVLEEHFGSAWGEDEWGLHQSVLDWIVRKFSDGTIVG